MAQAQFLTCFHGLIIPFVGKVFGQVFGPHFGAVEGFVFADAVHDPRQASGMIHFRVVADDNIDFGGVHHLGDIAEKLIGKRTLDRIDQGNFFIDDQKRIVRGAGVG